MASLTDGTSQTAFFSEKRRGQGTADPRTDMCMMDAATSLAQTYQTCTNLDLTMAMPLSSRLGATWAIGDMTCTTYNHVSGPNTSHLRRDDLRHDDAGGLDGEHGRPAPSLELSSRRRQCPVRRRVGTLHQGQRRARRLACPRARATAARSTSSSDY